MTMSYSIEEERDGDIESLSSKLFGRSRIGCISGGTCLNCGKAAVTFRDELSRKEFRISAFCQICQDSVFRK